MPGHIEPFCCKRLVPCITAAGTSDYPMRVKERRSYALLPSLSGHPLGKGPLHRKLDTMAGAMKKKFSALQGAGQNMTKL